jgi:transcriptional regulator with XRE-family HTH domain
LKFNGQQLRKLRIQKGMNKQQDLADSMGVSQNSISRWESGLSDPEPDLIEKLCKIFKVQRESLYIESDESADLREIVREECEAALRAIRIEPAMPDDIAEMLGRIKDPAIWEAIRALLKPYLRMQKKR